ncbi:MAG: S8 family serine peptidase [Propionicimonas sp.]
MTPVPPRGRVSRAAAFLLSLGLILTALGVVGVVRYSDRFGGGTTGPDTSQLPTGEIVFNDRMTLYRPPAESFALDEATGRVFVADELLVMFTAETTADQAAAAIAGWGGRKLGYLAAINRYEVVFDQPRSRAELTALAAELETHPLVTLAALNDVQFTTSHYQPDDAGWRSAWNGLAKPDGNWGMEAINAPVLWDYREDVAKGLGQVRVGVLDAGFVDNPDLKLDLLSPNQPNQHGAHVAGTIAAGFDNAEGVAGVVPTASGGTVKVSGVSADGLNSNAQAALVAAVQDIYDNGLVCLTSSTADLGLVYLVAERRARVVNYSMGLNPEYVETYAASRGNAAAKQALSEATLPTMRVLGRLLDGYDFLLVASAGNEARPIDFWNRQAGTPLFVQDEAEPYGYRRAKLHELPWGRNGEIAAAAGSFFSFIGSSFDQRTDPAQAELASRVREHIVVAGAAGLKDGRLYRAGFSNAGDRVDVYAPGVDIESTVGADAKGSRNCGGARCATMSGTSMAAPHVTGTLTALWAMQPELTSQQVRQLMLDNLQEGGEACPGRCFLDAGAAATALHQRLPASPTVPGTAEPGGGDTTTTSLVLDTSGSMGDASGRTQLVDDGAGGREERELSKLDAAKEASRVLLATIASTAARYDGAFAVGVARFSDRGSEVIAPTSRYAEVETAISQLSEGGGTNLLEAIRVGTNQVSGLTGSRTVILLSDGQDEAGNADAELLAAAKLAASAGVKICTVGFGEGDALNEGLLRQIAQTANCSYSHADASSAVALAGSFISAQLQSKSVLLAQQTATVARGQRSVALPLAVPDQSGDLTTVLYWPQGTDAAGATHLDAVLIDPEGVTVDASYPGVSLDDDQSPAQLVIADPKPGSWSLAVHGSRAAGDVEPYFLAAAFEQIEREYQVNQLPRLTAPGPQPIATDFFMAVTAVGLGAGLVLLLVGLALLSPGTRSAHRP